MNKEVLIKNFSECATYYDDYSTIQRIIASRLILRVWRSTFCNILDIGCGTGNYTRLLKMRFPQARITALDISREMINIAKRKLSFSNIFFVTEDAENVYFKEKFDFISSNATFQWFENLDTVLSRYKNFLKEDGTILFSTFGPLTFYELNEALNKIFKKRFLVCSCNFLDAKKIERILKRLFRKSRVKEEFFSERHNSLLELLKKIKYTGVKGEGPEDLGLWTPRIVNRLEKVYKELFGEIVSTYQIYFCEAKR